LESTTPRGHDGLLYARRLIERWIILFVCK
jgi:hypothetical protein